MPGSVSIQPGQGQAATQARIEKLAPRPRPARARRARRRTLGFYVDVARREPERWSLLRNHDFELLVGRADGAYSVGTEVSVLALPLVAIQMLHTTAFEVGALTAVETLPFLLRRPPGGRRVGVDRMPRRRCCITADVGRSGRARLGATGDGGRVDRRSGTCSSYAFVTGVFTVFFDVAYQSYLPELVERDELVRRELQARRQRIDRACRRARARRRLIGWVGASTAVVDRRA